jgi:hypothetical protein
MKAVLLMLASMLPEGNAVASETPVNLVGDPGFEKQSDAGRGTWVGTQNAGRATQGGQAVTGVPIQSSTRQPPRHGRRSGG